MDISFRKALLHQMTHVNFEEIYVQYDVYLIKVGKCTLLTLYAPVLVRKFLCRAA